MKATETKLSALHGAVAQVLTAQVLHEEAETTFDEEGNAVETGNMVYTATPATLAAAIKFLKDNNITCDIEVDKGMNSLKDALAAKQKHSRLTDVKLAAVG
jgi:hypothetical protein